VSRYQVPLCDVRDGGAFATHILYIPTSAEVNVVGMGISDDSGTEYTDLDIRVKEVGGATLIESSQISDPKGFNIQGEKTVVIEVENQTGSDLVAGCYVDFEIEFDNGPDDIGRTEIQLVDLRDGQTEGTHLVHVPSTSEAEFTRAGVHDSSGDAPTGLTLSADIIGGSNIFSTTQKSEIISHTVQGPADILIQLDNQTNADGTFGGFVDVTII